MAKNVKELLDFGLSVGELVSELSDGFQLGDIGELIEAGKKAKPALEDAKLALEEYKNMTDEEAKELEAFVVAEFDIADDVVESYIETALTVLIELHSLAALFAAKQPQPVPAKA